MHEEKQKIKNYKTELNDLVNKFKIIQDNYIKKKENNALIDDEPKMKPSELLSNEENKNNFDINNEKSPKINNNVINKKSEQNIFEENIGNISGVNKVPTINDDTFFNFKRGRKRYKKICLIIWITLIIMGLISIFIFLGTKK